MTTDAVNEIMVQSEIKQAARLVREAGFRLLELQEGRRSVVHRTTGRYYDLLIQWDNGVMEGIRQEHHGVLWTPGQNEQRPNDFVWCKRGATLDVVTELLALED